MSETGQGGVDGPLPPKDRTPLFGEAQRPKPPVIPSNPAVTDALLNDDKGALYRALEEQRRRKQGR